MAEDVKTGLVVSATITVLEAVDEFPAASVALYVIKYVPSTNVSTVPEEVTVIACPWSLAVAPAST